MLSGALAYSNATVLTYFTMSYTQDNYDNSNLAAVFNFSSSPSLLSDAITEFVGSDVDISDLVNVTLVTNSLISIHEITYYLYYAFREQSFLEVLTNTILMKF